MTRAKKTLTLVNEKRRMIYGNTSVNPPSRFISEIDDKYLEKDPEKDTQVFDKDDMFDDNATYKVGDKVIHSVYGEGIIVGVGNILTIAFSHKYGIKKIMKGHKSIRKVE